MDARFITRDFGFAPDGRGSPRDTTVISGLLLLALLLFGWVALVGEGFVVAEWDGAPLECRGMAAVAVGLGALQLAGFVGLSFARRLGWGLEAAASLLMLAVLPPLLWLLAHQPPAAAGV